MPSGVSLSRRVSRRPPPETTSMRASMQRKTRWYFGGFRARRVGSRCSKPAPSAWTTCRDAGARRPGAGSYELAARHRCDLPARQAPTAMQGSSPNWPIGCVLRDGRQHQLLQAWLTRLVDALQGRIHGFNVSVAHVWAEQERSLDIVGRRMPVEDGYIAATARRHGLTIATGNDRNFRRPGIKVFNPFKDLV